MKQTLNLPLGNSFAGAFGGWEQLRETLRSLGLVGVEGIWTGEPLSREIPSGLAVGYHLTFAPDWLDLYREDETALVRKFGSMEQVKVFYGGVNRETLLHFYADDFERAARLNPEYVVFHVSDVSVEEGYSYRWLHSDEEVIDAAAELLNTVLAGKNYRFRLLLENQWWPGFTFTDPKKTGRLLEAVAYNNTGILLDTGHLMNTNLELQTEAEGAAYIRTMARQHGSLTKAIGGIHLHRSLSGNYVKTHTGHIPENLPENYEKRYGVSYGHILQIDRHEPWTDPIIREVLEELAPNYVTHELSGPTAEKRLDALRRQLETIGR